MATAKVAIPKDANYSTEEKVHACNSRGYIRTYMIYYV